MTIEQVASKSGEDIFSAARIYIEKLKYNCHILFQALINIDMTGLSRLISRLQRGIAKNASYVKTIRHPQLLIIALQELNDLIGNEKVKESVATQVSHLIMLKRRALENSGIKEDEVMLNTVLYGPPGVGKTMIGAKLAKIWYALGYLDNSRNVRQKKQELGEIIKDIFKENGSMGMGGANSGDGTALAIYIMFIFVVILVTLLSMTWSFYSRFGGYWTLIVFSVLLLTIVGVGYYVSSVTASNINNNNNKGSGCRGKDCPINPPNKSINPTGIHNRNNTNEYGNSPVLTAMPPEEEIIKFVTRPDLVGMYQGWSANMTLKLLEENLGKVVFVDEAYSLVTDMHDSFGIEVLSVINLFLSQHPREIIVIFAGYKDLMEAGLFTFQPGLRRRFMWQFECSGYNDDQLFEIFKHQLTKKGWGLTDEEATRGLFSQNKGVFPSFGGDTERLAYFSELEHSSDFISNERGMSINLLSPDHISRGIIKLKENNIQKEGDVGSTNPLVNMMKLFRDREKINLSGVRRSSRQSDLREEDYTPSYNATDDIDIINTVRNSALNQSYH